MEKPTIHQQYNVITAPLTNQRFKYGLQKDDIILLLKATRMLQRTKPQETVMIPDTDAVKSKSQHSISTLPRLQARPLK